MPASLTLVCQYKKMTKSFTQSTRTTPRTILPRIIYITDDLYCCLVATQNTDDKDPLMSQSNRL